MSASRSSFRCVGLLFARAARLTHLQKIATMEKKLFSSRLHTDPRLPKLYSAYAAKQEASDTVRELRKRIQATHDVLQMEELKCRKRVLRRLGFTTAADIVDMKGRVACEISSGDELLLTELVFNGVFNALEPEQCAGLLSCFVFTEKVRVAFRSATSADHDPYRVSRSRS
jgi:ATP-dependent RNA helicase DOB1